MIGRPVCSFFTACLFAADFERVEAWSGVLRDRGIMGPAPGPQAFNTSQCASIQGTLHVDLARLHDAAGDHAEAELDALLGELARAFGLSGRARKASNVAEKARLNVTRAIRTATAKLAEALPGPGAVLDRRVRTGLSCIYEPHPDDEILWSVQPSVNRSARR